MKYRVCHLSFPYRRELQPKIVEASDEVAALIKAYPGRAKYMDFQAIWEEGNGKIVRVERMRPQIEEQCPCPECLKCCCQFVPSLVDMGFPTNPECANRDEGECKCRRDERELVFPPRRPPT